ncbi:MAG: membrane protein insertion efficiency factor YidD [Candidatus Gracilibacteria bacterium]
MINPIKKAIRYVRVPFLLLIRLYQKTISPDHGFLKALFPYGYCKFKPTCSQYTHLAIEKYGVIWGSLKGFWRILRCNPFSRGGEDNP